MKTAKIKDLTTKLQVPFKLGDEVFELTLKRASKKEQKEAQKKAKPLLSKKSEDEKRLEAITRKLTVLSEQASANDKKIKILEKAKDGKYDKKLLDAYEKVDSFAQQLNSLIDEQDLLIKKIPDRDADLEYENSEKIFEIYSKTLLEKSSYKRAEEFANEVSWQNVHKYITEAWASEDEGNLEYSSVGSSKTRKGKES
jgi:hypothetical protein